VRAERGQHLDQSVPVGMSARVSLDGWFRVREGRTLLGGCPTETTAS
jgi:hypothetical protein